MREPPDVTDGLAAVDRISSRATNHELGIFDGVQGRRTYYSRARAGNSQMSSNVNARGAHDVIFCSVHPARGPGSPGRYGPARTSARHLAESSVRLRAVSAAKACQRREFVTFQGRCAKKVSRHAA